MTRNLYFPDFKWKLSCRGITTNRGCLVTQNVELEPWLMNLLNMFRQVWKLGQRPLKLNDQQMALSVQISAHEGSTQRSYSCTGGVIKVKDHAVMHRVGGFICIQTNVRVVYYLTRLNKEQSSPECISPVIGFVMQVAILSRKGINYLFLMITL